MHMHGSFPLFFLYVSKNVLSRVSCIVCYLWMLLRHVLFGELC